MKYYSSGPVVVENGFNSITFISYDAKVGSAVQKSK